MSNSTEDTKVEFTSLVNRLIARGDEEAAAEIMRLRSVIGVVAKTIASTYPNTAAAILKELEDQQIWRRSATSS